MYFVGNIIEEVQLEASLVEVTTLKLKFVPLADSCQLSVPQKNSEDAVFLVAVEVLILKYLIHVRLCLVHILEPLFLLMKCVILLRCRSSLGKTSFEYFTFLLEVGLFLSDICYG